MTIKNVAKKICEILGEKKVKKTKDLFQIHAIIPNVGVRIIHHTTSWEEAIEYASKTLDLEFIQVIWKKEAIAYSKAFGPEYQYVIHAE